MLSAILPFKLRLLNYNKHNYRSSSWDAHAWPASSCDIMAMRLFVYGTLKRGGNNYYLMRGDQGGVARLLAKGRLARPHPMVVVTKKTTCPYVLPMEGSGKVRTKHYDE